jgi:hypothetical protein
VVPQLFINGEEEIAKVVGRHLQSPSALSVRTSGKADGTAWRKAFGGVRVPRGIHWFHTREEADDWLWRMITRPS